VFRRSTGRGGPGAGRPAELYRRSPRELAVSLPERRYKLAGRVLVRTILDAEQAGLPIVETLGAAADALGATADAGRARGEEARHRAGPRPGRAALAAVARRMLEEHGYEPRAGAGGLVLANCPFHALAQDSTELVCGMNLDLIDGLLDGLDGAKLESRLDPAPGRCCVVVRPRAAAWKESP
jgi:predicted ArsR family transcriptional regulator